LVQNDEKHSSNTGREITGLLLRSKDISSRQSQNLWAARFPQFEAYQVQVS
jgi:hypothetical protein